MVTKNDLSSAISYLCADLSDIKCSTMIQGGCYTGSIVFKIDTSGKS